MKGFLHLTTLFPFFQNSDNFLYQKSFFYLNIFQFTDDILFPIPSSTITSKKTTLVSNIRKKNLILSQIFFLFDLISEFFCFNYPEISLNSKVTKKKQNMSLLFYNYKTLPKKRHSLSLLPAYFILIHASISKLGYFFNFENMHLIA